MQKEITQLVICLFFATKISAQNNIQLTGIIVDEKTNKPIPQVHITFNGRNESDLTDDNGIFKLIFVKDIYIGKTIRLKASKEGYKNIDENIIVQNALPLNLRMKKLVPVKKIYTQPSKPSVANKNPKSIEVTDNNNSEYAPSTYSQRISIEEMINKTKCKTFSCFSDFVTTKGFSYYKVIQEENYKLYAFTSDARIDNSSNENSTSKNMAWFHLSNDGKETRITMNTGDRNYYSILINQMNAKLFVENSSETTEEGNVRIIYTSSNYPNMSIKILTARLTNEDRTWTNYDIEVRNFR